jgi:hypothetical protein
LSPPSHLLTYKEEVEVIESLLIKNNYPKKLITAIKEKRERNKDKEKLEKKPVANIILPYVPRLGEKIKNIASKFDIRVVFSSKDTLRSNLVNFRPNKVKGTQKEVIYKIPCECGRSYIGETGRTFDVRLNEHKRSLKKGDPDISKLCEHHFNTGHRFLWDKAKVIGKEQHFRARKVHEAGEILRGQDRIISTPSFNIDPVWRPIIKNLEFPKNKNKEEKVRRSQRIKERDERRRGEEGKSGGEKVTKKSKNDHQSQKVRRRRQASRR